VEPEPFVSAEVGELVERVDRARADRARGADDEERQVALLAVGCDPFAQRRNEQALLVVRLDPANALGAEAEEVGGLLDPGMRLRGDIGAEGPSVRGPEAVRPD
jgi:hypothetical protein